MAKNDLMGAEITDITPYVGSLADFDAELADGDEDVQNVVKRSVSDAIQHFEENVEPDMAKATDYYFGRPFGDEKAGRSQVVSTDLRDATLDQIPDLLEIYTGSDSVVEFKPRSSEDTEMAKQATDMVNYVFYEDNDGFLILNSIFKDAGVRRLGYTKWWWEEKDRVRGERLTGISEEDLIAFSEDDEVDYEIVGSRQDSMQVQDPETGEMVLQPITVHDIEVKRVSEKGRVRVEEVPPEEIVWTPEARKFSRAPCIAHVREVPMDELLRMGIDYDFIDENRGVRKSRSTESLPYSRQFYGNSSASEMTRSRFHGSENVDESQEPIMFTEAYMLIDTDGDGIGEMRVFQCVGPDFTIVPDENGETFGELIDEVPIAAFTPDPEPHTVPGLCNFDYLKEIQKVKSQIQRGTLNSLAQSIENQMVVAQSEVNIRDLISPEISGIIRVRRDVNSIREIKHTFVGGDTLPVLAYYDQIKADRTGQVGPGEGMDPNIMQSTTAEAVNSSISKGQKRIKMLARVYAETGFKYMFKGIFKLLVKHQNRERMVRLRNQWVPVDPRYWDSGMDIRVNVALGTGSRSEKLNGLQGLYMDQKEQFMSGSPLVKFSHLRATAGKITDTLGYKDTDQFYAPWGEQEQAQWEQQQAEAAKGADKDADQRIVDVEELKVQLDSMAKQRDHDLKLMDIQLKDQRERDKTAREFALREYEIELQYKAKIGDLELKAKVAAAKTPS